MRFRSYHKGTNQSSLAKWIGKTREIALSQATKAGINFTGTADRVAGMMQEAMEEVGGDGSLIFNGLFDRPPPYITLVPLRTGTAHGQAVSHRWRPHVSPPAVPLSSPLSTP
jgi:hypothetical protein